MGGTKRKELKRKEEEEGKHQVVNGDRESKREREKESHLCQAKYFHNYVENLVVRHINKVFDF